MINAEIVQDLRAANMCRLSLLLVTSRGFVLGWLVNTSVLRQGKKTVILFVLYTIACCSCYILSVMTINPVVDSNHYQTFANYFSLLFRCFVMFLFVFELKETTQEEKSFEKLQFFHHFGACCMVRRTNLAERKSIIILALFRFGSSIPLH
jgi:hypothetical protein